MFRIGDLSQVNMNVGSSDAAWRQSILPKADEGYTLLTLVTSSSSQGSDMITQLMQQCRDCKAEGIPVHYYGTDPCDPNIREWYAEFQLLIWIAKFGRKVYRHSL